MGHKWIYVTDGGHYDNLGLVEALRRNPRQIYLLDASSDPEHSYRSLGQAIALARSELGVEISIDPGQIGAWPRPAPSQSSAPQEAGDGQSPNGIQASTGSSTPGPRPPQVVQPFAVGTFRYSFGPQAGHQGTISLIKLGVWAGNDLPWDVRAYYQAHPTFPRSSTVQQLYDDEDFEAYRELGAASMRALLAASRRRTRRPHHTRKAPVPAIPEPTSPG